MDNGKNDIFISIPSYNDIDLPRTLDAAIRASSGQHQLHFAVCEQVTEYVAAWELGVGWALPSHVRLSYTLHGTELLGVGGARAEVESMYDGEEYMLMIDAHTRFDANWDRVLVASQYRLPSEKALLSAVMPPDAWSGRHKVPLTACSEMDDDGFPAYTPHITNMSERFRAYPARHAHVCSLFGPAWFADAPQDPHIVFMGEEPVFTARLWTAGYDLYHMTMPIMHGAIRSPGRPWETPEWFERNAVSRRRCRHILGIEACEPDDPALRDIDVYGMGTARSFDDWQRWSGFDYRAGTVVEKWGAWA